MQAQEPQQERIVGSWGKAQMSETVSNGQHTGYMITCRRHRNADDADGAPPCMKHLALGTVESTRMTNDECMRRLKRWFITGNQSALEETWPADRQRDSHVNHCGGYRLKEFASDSPAWLNVCDADLDMMCTAVE